MVLAPQDDERAKAELVRRYEQKIRGFIHKLVKNEELTEELFQETFLHVFRSLASYRPEYPFRTWIYGIANNRVVDYSRKKKLKTTPIENDDDLASSTRTGDSSTASISRRVPRKIDTDVKRKMKELRGVVRYCLKLRYEENLSVEEIARRTGLPAGTVKTHLHRGPKKVRAAVSQDRKRKRSGPK